MLEAAGDATNELILRTIDSQLVPIGKINIGTTCRPIYNRKRPSR